LRLLANWRNQRQHFGVLANADRGGHIVRRTTTAAGLFFLILGLTAGSASALTDVEWQESVEAAQAVDPTLAEPPLTGTEVSAVGGGKLNPMSTVSTVAFSASRRDGEVRGRMTMANGFGATFSANVVCIGAVVSPSGEGGLARLVGRLTDPQPGGQVTMFFDVFDSDAPGGEGDLFSQGQSTVPAEEFPCEPLPPIDPIASGNFAVRSLD
jgi:hypothetical protein